MRTEAFIQGQQRPEAERAALLAAYREGLRSTGGPEAMQVQSALLAELAGLMDFLDARRSHWSVEEGQIAFDNQPDLDTFTAILSRIDQHQDRLVDFQQRRAKARE